MTHAELRRELDRLATEGFRAELAEVDRLPMLDIATLMNAEDATVPAAVAAELPAVATAIDAIVARTARGGRLVHAGAGTAGRLGVPDAGECPPTFNTAPGRVSGLVAGGPAVDQGSRRASGRGAAWRTARPETARVSATYRRRRPVRSSGSPSTTATGSSRTT